MTLTIIQSPPALDSFVLLEDHQSQTPVSFFRAKPVLYYHIVQGRILVAMDQMSKLPILSPVNVAGRGVAIGQTGEGQGLVEIVDVFVSSENFTLFNNSTSTGVSIPYPSIALHAIQRLPNPDDTTQEIQGLYMQLELEAGPSADDEEPETIELTILPPLLSPNSQYIQGLFEAVSSCSNLHPDPICQDNEDPLDEDSDSRIVFEGNVGYEGISGLPYVVRGPSDDGLPPPFPGSSGWITADNIGEFFDEEGNWLSGSGDKEEETLGEGAGRVRRRDEVEARNEAGGPASRVNGHRIDDEEEHKRARTE